VATKWSTQQDAVLTLAKLLWRKQRIQIYIAARAAERENSREQAVRFALGVLRVDPDSVAQVLRMCPEDIGRALEKKIPRGNYATESDWHLAVREQLELILRSDLNRQMETWSFRKILLRPRSHPPNPWKYRTSSLWIWNLEPTNAWNPGSIIPSDAFCTLRPRSR